MRRGAMLSAVALAIGSVAEGRGQDAARIKGPEACVECHQAAHRAWSATTHQTSYRQFHGRPETEEILAKLGERSARRAVCVDCHYTVQQDPPSRPARPIAGVSCESCHGAAAEWLTLHSDFGTTAAGGKATQETEQPDHRRVRLQRTAEMGMLRPDQPYQLASNCLRCHAVANQEVITKGGHQTGSDFELVAWLSGEVRHNFQTSQDRENREASRVYRPTDRRRVLYVLGWVADLEQALRGLAAATTEDAYATAMTQRARRAMERLRAIQERAPSLAGTLGEMLAVAGQATLAPNNKPGLLAAAERARSSGVAIANRTDGSDLGGLDPLLPAPDKYKGAAARG